MLPSTDTQTSAPQPKTRHPTGPRRNLSGTSALTSPKPRTIWHSDEVTTCCGSGGGCNVRALLHSHADAQCATGLQGRVLGAYAHPAGPCVRVPKRGPIQPWWRNGPQGDVQLLTPPFDPQALERLMRCPALTTHSSCSSSCSTPGHVPCSTTLKYQMLWRALTMRMKAIRHNAQLSPTDNLPTQPPTHTVTSHGKSATIWQVCTRRLFNC